MSGHSFTPLLAGILAPGGNDRPALCDRGTTVTYGQLRNDVLAVREALMKIGIRPGDRVAVCLPKTVRTVETMLGILAADAAYVPLKSPLDTGSAHARG